MKTNWIAQLINTFSGSFNVGRRLRVWLDGSRFLRLYVGVCIFKVLVVQWIEREFAELVI